MSLNGVRVTSEPQLKRLLWATDSPACAPRRLVVSRDAAVAAARSRRRSKRPRGRGGEVLDALGALCGIAAAAAAATFRGRER